MTTPAFPLTVLRGGHTATTRRGPVQGSRPVGAPQLRCPHCGLVVLRPGDEEEQYCPRCLERSRGALSVVLTRSVERDERLRGGLLRRLARLM